MNRVSLRQVYSLLSALNELNKEKKANSVETKTGFRFRTNPLVKETKEFHLIILQHLEIE